MSDKQSNLGWAFDQWLTALDGLVTLHEDFYSVADDVADTSLRTLPPQENSEYTSRLISFWSGKHGARLRSKQLDSLTRLQALMREARRTIIALVGADDEDEGDEEEGELYDD